MILLPVFASLAPLVLKRDLNAQHIEVVGPGSGLVLALLGGLVFLVFEIKAVDWSVLTLVASGSVGVVAPLFLQFLVNPLTRRLVSALESLLLRLSGVCLCGLVFADFKCAKGWADALKSLRLGGTG